MNLNQRIAGYGRKLKTERLLVDEMLARYPQSLLESATALARAVGTSASTVVRLLAKLGYDSYAQAQTEARAEVTARLASPGERADAMGADGHGARACLHNALLHDQHNLQATFSTVDPAVFEAAVRALTQRKARVRAGAEAGRAAGRLRGAVPEPVPAGRAAAGHAGPLFLEDQLLWVDERDVLLAFTFRRYSVAAARRCGCSAARREGGADHRLGFRAGRALGRPGAGGAVLQRLAVRFTAPMALCNAAAGGGGSAAGSRWARRARGEALWDAQWIRLNAGACRPPGQTVCIFP